MKKLFTMMSLAVLSAAAMAQRVTTHSVYDVDQSNDISVSDATKVVDHVVKNMAPEQTQQYVTGEELNEVLGNIYELLGKLDQKLNYVMRESGISNPFIPDENGIFNNGHEYVDLGVVVDGRPLYWATTNIGAKLPADYGFYFAWGETIGYSEDVSDGKLFDWANYKYMQEKMSSWHYITKYTIEDKKPGIWYDGDTFVGDGNTVLEPKDDAAHENWLGAWRMPTQAEQHALHSQCDWTWTTMTNSAGKSVTGYIVSNKSDSSKYIFLPAAGYRYGDYIYRTGTYGYYWSSSLDANFSGSAYLLNFDSSDNDRNSFNRFIGLTVRPVCQ